MAIFAAGSVVHLEALGRGNLSPLPPSVTASFKVSSLGEEAQLPLKTDDCMSSGSGNHRVSECFLFKQGFSVSSSA